MLRACVNWLQEVPMARFFIAAKWNGAGAAGARSDGFAKRAENTRTVWESLGGTVECVYFGSATSEWDVVTIVDGITSDHIQAVASMVMASGTVVSGTAMELRTGEEADSAIASVEVAWRAPGQA